MCPDFFHVGVLVDSAVWYIKQEAPNMVPCVMSWGLLVGNGGGKYTKPPKNATLSDISLVKVPTALIVR